MTAAESARDLLATVTKPISYTELAAHLSRDYSPELFDAMSGLVLCQAEEMAGPELSRLLWAYATVGHRDSGLAATLVQALASKLSDLDPSELANAAWAVSRLGLHDPDFVSAAMEQVWEGLPSATPRQLAAVLQAYATFRQADPQLEEDHDLLRSIAIRFRAQLATATPTELALTLSGMARLRCADGALLTEACSVFRRNAANIELAVLAEAAWAIALLQHRDTAVMEAVAERVAEALRRASTLAPTSPGLAASVAPSLPLPLPLRPSAAAFAEAARGKAPAVLRSGAEGGGVHGAPGEPKERRSVPQRFWRPGQSAMAPLAAADSAPLRFSAVWPTHVGPGGHRSPTTLFDRFNPALPDDWSPEAAAAATGAAPAPPTPDEAAEALLETDADALLDVDVVSKLLWAFGSLHCYSGSLYTLLFRQLPRLHHDRASWSALARLMGAQVKAFELQPQQQGHARINPLEAESVSAWARLQRARPALHKLPEHWLPTAFVAFQGEAAGRDADWTHGASRPLAAATADPSQPQPPGQKLSRPALQAQVAAALQALGVQLRPNSTLDGMFMLDHTALINGLSLSLEVLSSGCCTLEVPHRPLGHAAARMRSLEFRGWTLLVVPFYEWDALGAEEGPQALMLAGSQGGAARRATALAAAAQARQAYLRRKLEGLLGEELPPMPAKLAKRRAAEQA
ncbi:hypothetical protein HYH03_000943 [Edaphochlamys debaryana]|uniref:RAP domain-containing protein n=1 Tax=Edaphochlamys debaryana TaxID=47281 RepID=A0A835YMA5_9CHLO|nr:hypothetical protein HYH03_000943 [Edaphochlamys debaryana]|eukprot:KAG2501125.1 hypothetical protein HYH03_000943 [Edaphochlamys debaryana]